MQEQISEVIYYAKGILRYKWIAIIMAWIVSLSGWIFIYNMPDKYSSEARVYVDTRTMLRPLLSGLAIQVDVNGLLRVMKQLMFTQQNLEQIAKLSGLNGLESHDRLKENIKISGGNNEIFSISYEAENREEARNVVQAVLAVFSEQTQRSSLGDTAEAQRFIEGQIREYEDRLRNAEKARENFKRANLGLLPGQGVDQISQIQRMKTALEEAELSLKEAKSRKEALSEQLEEALGSEDEWSDLIGTESSSKNERISALEQRKDELLIKYKENHPEIKNIDNIIKELKRREDEKQNSGENEGLDLEVMANPYVQSIKVAMNEADANVASILSRVDNYNTRLAKLQEELNTRLSIETEIHNLNRDYETIKRNYSNLIQRREQANISTKVDSQVNALKFRIADPPNKPLEPSSPNRLLLTSVVFFVSILLGVGSSLLVTFIRPTFVATQQVRADTGIPILGTVSMSFDSPDTTGHKIDYKSGGAILGLIIMYIGSLLFETFKSTLFDIEGLVQGIYAKLSFLL